MEIGPGVEMTMTRGGLGWILHPNWANVVTAVLAVCALAGTLTVATQTSAQSSNIGDEVVVDLSVLSDGGVDVINLDGRNLLLPPHMAPSSKLYVTPVSGAKLRRPATKIAVAKPKVTSAAMPAKKQVAAAILAPPAAAPKPPVVAPKRPATPIIAAPKMSSTPPPPLPSPKPAVTAAAKQVEKAAIPKRIDLKPGRALRLEFADGESNLSINAKSDLKQISNKARDSTKFRIQLLAFAGGKNLSSSKARRLSLSRALSVRSQLIESGLRSTQINVRALGNKTADKPLNRVDVNFVER